MSMSNYVAPHWLTAARLMAEDGRTIQGALELRRLGIGDEGSCDSSRREGWRRGLRTLALEGAIARRGLNNLVIVVDQDRLAELLEEDPEAVTYRHSRQAIRG
jgi:hypothetical protein